MAANLVPISGFPHQWILETVAPATAHGLGQQVVLTAQMRKCFLSEARRSIKHTEGGKTLALMVIMAK